MNTLGALEVLRVPARQTAGTKPKPQGEWPPKLEETPASPHADLANAHRLVKHKGAGLAFVSTQGWLRWRDKGPWKRDELGARKAASSLGRIIASESTELSKKAGDIEDETARKDAMRKAEERMKWARASESRNSVAAALCMAEPLLSVDSEKVDGDPMLLGCLNGTLDLRTSILRPHDPLDWITKTTGANFDPRAQAPTWARFLQDIMLGDQELIDWLQAFFGFCLTGLTTEHLLVIAHGSGSNGKSTLITVLEHVLKDYAKAAPPGLLMAKRNEGHPTDRMDLRGARLVITVESGEHNRLAEDQVKAMTGGDTLKGRFMYRDFESFSPTHKLMLLTNHKPSITGTDHGIWRRIKLVPFLAKFEDGANKDLQMPEKLKAEAPGILRWCVDGLQKYLRAGRFPPCKAIELASKQYQADSDLIGQFLADECTTGPGFRATSRELYEAFKGWCEDNGQHVWAKRTFGMRMAERGFSEYRTNSARGWEGLHINAEEQRMTYRSRSG